MADQPTSTAAKKSKKGGGIVKKLFRDLIKRPNESASQSNATRVSVSAFGDHDPVLGNDVGSAETMSSSKQICLHLCVIDDDFASLQMSMLP